MDDDDDNDSSDDTDDDGSDHEDGDNGAPYKCNGNDYDRRLMMMEYLATTTRPVMKIAVKQ